MASAELRELLNSIARGYQRYAEQLHDAGYWGIAELAAARAETLCTVAQVPVPQASLIVRAARTQKIDPMAHFESLLRRSLFNNNPEEKVLQRVALHFAPQALIAQTTAQADYIYNQAEQLPGTSTRLIAEQQGILINSHYGLPGGYTPHISRRSAVVHAFQGSAPVMLKFPRIGDAARHESQVWQQLSSGGTPPHLAGPVTLLDLKNDSTGRSRCALQMPMYPATLQHIPKLTPDAALKVGRDIQTGLKHMHLHQLVHCDVKATNIFIDGSGDAFLGDYGAVRSLGEPVSEITWSHVPLNPPEGVCADWATRELDFLLLAVTMLERMELLQLGRGRVNMASVLAAVEQVKHRELHEFIMMLLQPAAAAQPEDGLP